MNGSVAEVKTRKVVKLTMSAKSRDILRDAIISAETAFGKIRDVAIAEVGKYLKQGGTRKEAYKLAREDFANCGQEFRDAKNAQAFWTTCIAALLANLPIASEPVAKIRELGTQGREKIGVAMPQRSGKKGKKGAKGATPNLRDLIRAALKSAKGRRLVSEVLREEGWTMTPSIKAGKVKVPTKAQPKPRTKLHGPVTMVQASSTKQ